MKNIYIMKSKIVQQERVNSALIHVIMALSPWRRLVDTPDTRIAKCYIWVYEESA